MATLTNSHHYPVERVQAFAYLTNPSTWTDYYSGIVEIDDPEATFDSVGDTVGFTYSLLGRRLKGSATIDEVRSGELIRHTARVEGLPDVHQTWEYRDAGNGCSVEVTMTTEESASFLGKTIDRFVIPRALGRDIARTLDKIEDVFALGVPEV
jgi:hypothetical protein